MSRILLNNCTTRLTAALGTSDTTAHIPDADVAKFTAKGALSASNYVIATLVKTSGFREVAWEIVKVTGTGTGTLTIARAQESTTPLSLSIGDVVSVRFTAGIYEDVTTYTPSFSGWTTSPSSVTASYSRIGATVHVKIAGYGGVATASGTISIPHTTRATIGSATGVLINAGDLNSAHYVRIAANTAVIICPAMTWTGKWWEIDITYFV